MPAQASGIARPSWTLAMDIFLIEAITDQVKDGKRADSSFRKEAWVSVHDSINEELGKSLTIQQIKTRMQTVRLVLPLLLLLALVRMLILYCILSSKRNTP